MDRLQIQRIKTLYPVGTRVELISMNDRYARLQKGEKGTVLIIDDLGTVHVEWDCGSLLGVVLEEDRIKKL